MAACPTAAAQRCDTPTQTHTYIHTQRQTCVCARIDAQVTLAGQIIKGDLRQLRAFVDTHPGPLTLAEQEAKTGDRWMDGRGEDE